MSKQNKILFGILAFIVACTIGYALFSETITITGTATAKGEWKLTTTCQLGLTEGLEYNSSSANSQGYEYANDSCNVVENIVTYSVDLKMPSAYRYYTIKTKNTGTIPVALNPETGMINTSTICSYSADHITKECLNDEYKNDYISTIGYLEDENGNIYGADSEEFFNFMDQDTGELIIKPGQSIYTAVLNIWYENDTLIGKNSTDYLKLDNHFQFNFEQVKAK